MNWEEEFKKKMVSAEEAAGCGIPLNLIAPGTVLTPMGQAIIDAPQRPGHAG